MFNTNRYPKNYHSSGTGLINLAALGYSANEQKGISNNRLYPSLPSSSFLQSESFPSSSYFPRQYGEVSDTSKASTLPYPVQMPHSNASTLPYPVANSGMPLPYPVANSGMPLPYPVTYPGMPLPYDNASTSSKSSGYSSIYPSLPSLPNLNDSNLDDGYKSSNLTVRSEDEPSVGVPEILFSAVSVPENENMFWLGEKAKGLRANADVQNFDTLRNNCLGNGTLFEDDLFPASNESIMFSRRPDRHIEWLRPHEIVDDPEFFVEGYSRFDVQQGELGDCWLLAAAANLTQDSSLFFRVVPPEQSFQENYAGIFHFCFWQYGKWIDVVIDDRLPTYNGELLYMHSTEKNEFWSALLEKAYAKLHGSYEALKGGTTCEAMEDFTGGVTEWYDLKEAPSNLFNILQKACERSSMMGCSLEPDPNVLEAETSEGLIRGHAYSITRVCFIDIVTPNRKGKIPMIRMRNPWGNEAEWNGPWSDSSPEWRYIPEDQKQEIGLTFDRDGEFWMSFQDFLNHFDRVEICNLSPDSLTEDQMNDGKRRWEMSMFEGEWTPGVTAGGCRNYLETFWHNPQYVITLTDPDEEDDDGKCTVIVALMQKNRRSRRNMGMECLTIGFAIYHLTDRDMETRPQEINFFKYRASVARSPHFINTREVCARFKLPVGHYLIVPSTFDPNEEGEFIIRVFSETKNNMIENDDQVGYGDIDDRISRQPSPSPAPQPEDQQHENLKRLFISIAGADMEVDWMELKRILDHSMRDDIPNYDGTINQNSSTFPATKINGEHENNQTSTGSNLLSLLCGPFCKGTPFEDMLGANDEAYDIDRNQTNNTLISTAPVLDDSTGFSKDVCRSMVAMMDTDQSGKLGLEEFEALLTDIARWKVVFKLYDVNGTGRIDGFQLREALKSAGYHLNNRILNALAHRYGSHDGKIAFDDFLMCAVKIKTYINIFKERDTGESHTATFSMDDWIERTIYS